MKKIIKFIIGYLLLAAFQNKKNKKSTTVKVDETDLSDFRIDGSTGHSGQPKPKNRQRGKCGNPYIMRYSEQTKAEDTQRINSGQQTIIRYSEQPKAKDTQHAKWIKPGEIVKVNNFKIRNGFIYFGEHLKSLDDYDTESSLVDPTLIINTKSPDYSGEQMGYWPSYCYISQESRAAYIEWLAGNRSDPKTYIGYIFLYFYGIERRLLVDDRNGLVSEDEHNALVKELWRLKNVYGGNHSFNGYVTNLLSHTWVMKHHSKSTPPNPDLLIAKKNFTSVFKYLLASTVKNGYPVTSELALTWVKSHPLFSLRTPARRCEKEFNMLFKIRFKQKFGDGLKITPNRTRLQLDYHPASSSLRGYQSIKLNLPDVSLLKAPVKKLMSLAESCTDELEPLSRFVGREKNANNLLAATTLLPDDLITSMPHPKFERLKTWMTTQVSGTHALVSLESILEHFGEEAPSKINKKEAELLANTAEKAGFGIAPDIRFHHAKPDTNGKIVLFPGGHGEGFSPSQTFKQVGTILRLGTMVAGIDNHINEAEVGLLKNLITADDRLTETEKRSLNAYMHWRLNTPANMTGLKARLQTINSLERTAVSHILIGVALADGKIEPTEIKQLEKLYTSLGLDKSMVTSDIHSLSSATAARSKAGTKTAIESPPDTTVFSLDRDLLKVHEEETQDVQAVLESIFVEENALDESEKEMTTAAASSGGTISSLDSKYHSLYEKIITKEKWSFDEFKALCEERQLMVAGAIEVINDWAFDNVSATLIEDGDTVFIDLELAKEIATL